MPVDQMWTIEAGRGPVIATAIHAGHELRPEVAERCALGDAERLREEDPHTHVWTVAGDTRIVVWRSRFEVDINRPPDKAVYLKPEDAWGLSTYSAPPPAGLVDRSRAEYDAYYSMLRGVVEEKLEHHRQVVVFDLHSYNHRRGGPDAEPDDPALNPDINVGTGSMDRQRWAEVMDAFLDQARKTELSGRPLDVRENVKFMGGNMVRWLHQTFPSDVCAIAIEVKKIYMDEWTGVVDIDAAGRIQDGLQAAAARIRGILASQ